MSFCEFHCLILPCFEYVRFLSHRFLLFSRFGDLTSAAPQIIVVTLSVHSSFSLAKRFECDNCNTYFFKDNIFKI